MAAQFSLLDDAFDHLVEKQCRYAASADNAPHAFAVEVAWTTITHVGFGSLAIWAFAIALVRRQIAVLVSCAGQVVLNEIVSMGGG